MNTLTKKRYRKKARSCPHCKPNKTHGSDKRTVQQAKHDQKYLNEVKEL